MTFLDNFHFLRPWGVLLLMPWTLLLLNALGASPLKSASRAIAPHLLRHLYRSGHRRRLLTPTRVTMAMLVIATLMLMGPSWRLHTSHLTHDQTAMVVMLDLSESMLQSDVEPTRLGRAKQKVRDLLALQPAQRVGLVAYAGTAHEVLSLTTDHRLIESYLQPLVPTVMPIDGKYPEQAMTVLEALLDGYRHPVSVILVSDAVDADIEPRFADFFKARGYQLLVLAVSPTAFGYTQDSLVSLADAAGGYHVKLTLDDRDVQELYRRTQHFYTSGVDSPVRSQDDGYLLVLLLALFFLLYFRKGWLLYAGCFVLPLVLGGVAPIAAATGQSSSSACTSSAWLRPGGMSALWLTSEQKASLLFSRGCYLAAAAGFENPMWKGTAYYYAGEFSLAASSFARLTSEKALFNQATATAMARNYHHALRLYDRLLDRNREFPGAAENRRRLLPCWILLKQGLLLSRNNLMRTIISCHLKMGRLIRRSLQRLR